MNIRELIDQLQEIAEERGDETEVRMAFQPSYPLEYELRSAEEVDFSQVECETCEGAGSDDSGKCPDCNGKGEIEKEGGKVVVYLIQGNETSGTYLPGEASRQIGWR